MQKQRLLTRWRWIIVAIGLVLMLSSHAAEAAEGIPVPPDGLSPPEKPTSIPDFNLPSVDGKTIHASDLRGKVVVMRFWSTW